MLRRLLGRLGPSFSSGPNGENESEDTVKHLSCPRCRSVLIIPRAERFRCQCQLVFRVTGTNKIQLCLNSRNGGDTDGQECGLPRALVERMPITIVDEEACAALTQGTDSEDCNKSCRICLSDYKVGDSVRVLPCFHRFHASEIDDWLDRNTTCPLCYLDVSEALTGSSGVAFLTAVEGNPMPFLDRGMSR